MLLLVVIMEWEHLLQALRLFLLYLILFLPMLVIRRNRSRLKCLLLKTFSGKTLQVTIIDHKKKLTEGLQTIATNNINISPNNGKEVVHSFFGKVADSLANSIRATCILLVIWLLRYDSQKGRDVRKMVPPLQIFKCRVFQFVEGR